MKKQRIPWGKAPKLRHGILLGHSFTSDGDGYFEYLKPYVDPQSRLGYLHNFTEFSGLKKPKEIDWKTSFTPAPRKRK